MKVGIVKFECLNLDEVKKLTHVSSTLMFMTFTIIIINYKIIYELISLQNQKKKSVSKQTIVNAVSKKTPSSTHLKFSLCLSNIIYLRKLILIIFFLQTVVDI